MIDGSGVRASVTLIGCGQLGSRHLQALSTVPEVGGVTVVDPDPEALRVGRECVDEVAERVPDIGYAWVTDLEQAPTDGDLCVVATLSEGRRELVERIAAAGRYEAFLLEKVVTQTVGDYEALVSLAEERRLGMWVNCKTRAYAVHGRIKERLGGRPVRFVQQGGNHGLGNNGIHTADLFAFYTGAEEIEPVCSRIDPVLHPSKRGERFFDLSGTLHGCTADGSEMVVQFTPRDDFGDHISIFGEGCRFLVDHSQGFAWESYEEDGWRWAPIELGEDWLVSRMTARFARDILAKGRCALPTIAECLPAHRYILGELLPHFRELLDPSLERCPIT